MAWNKRFTKPVSHYRLGPLTLLRFAESITVDRVAVREMTPEERTFVTEFRRSSHLPLSVIEVTNTQLEKSIIDATWAVRRSFLNTGFHDFDQQLQGTEHKVVKDAALFGNAEAPQISSISLYRPNTKEGDPRLWIYGLQRHIRLAEGDLLLLAVAQDAVAVLNLTRPPNDGRELGHHCRATLLTMDKRNSSATGDYEQVTPSAAVGELPSQSEPRFEQVHSSQAAAEILLAKLRAIALAGPIETTKKGDTAVGFALESALGIKQNSSIDPDFLGIELKATRTNSTTRVNLFAQVPNWSISQFKSSEALLDAFGYVDAKGRDALQVTVKSSKPNTQGLRLRPDFATGYLDEISEQNGVQSPVVRWEVDKLIDRLTTKHAETFWVTLSETKGNGVSSFTLNSLVHTRLPDPTAFGLLIADDAITLDHLIARRTKGVTEKGPLFKIWHNDLPALFHVEAEYEL